MDYGLDCGQGYGGLSTEISYGISGESILDCRCSINSMTTIRIGLILLTLALVPACNRHAHFAHQIAKADRLVVTKKVKVKGFISMAVDGEQAREVVSAVNSGEICGDVPPPVEALKVEFFKGTNSLGRMEFYEGIFWTKDGEYSDPTGSLRILEKSPPEKWH
jgi:hypothetical protein